MANDTAANAQCNPYNRREFWEPLIENISDQIALEYDDEERKGTPFKSLLFPSLTTRLKTKKSPTLLGSGFGQGGGSPRL